MAAIARETQSIKQAVILINGIDAGKFPRLLSRILQKLHLKAAYYNMKPAALQQQLENIHLSQEKAEAFVQAWANMGQDIVEKLRQSTFAPKKLEKIGFCLNLEMGHSTQAKMKSPHAILELGVNSEDSENTEKVLLEFNHGELLEFYNKLETIQTQLDALT
ncbi:COMM domain-containing protein 10 isoform X2 [Carcharodon carcharias]|uniref:COMM domain-containing protein 10 isoform X2 n=1 Tax=Carcharodon carcharias TaxID=13397 RepID=UPI001B7E65F1|nr:COMM domain-containing protein 10 isoform X2 [Carcharodon carcharias]